MRPFLVLLASACLCASASADTFSFDNGSPDGRMGMASRPSRGGVNPLLEIEAADDFILTTPTSITSASFYGLIPTQASISSVTVEIYRVFPNDSDISRVPQVPTRTNSPSDVAFASRSSAGASELTFSATNVGDFAVSNSVVNGINKFPNQNTGGEGPVTGREVLISTLFTNPFDLRADHFFFVPQVELSDGTFLWLSSAFPNAALTPDLQAWIRNENLAPDWLRVGTDIVGGTEKFNGAFSLQGETVAATPEPGAWLLSLSGAAAGAIRMLRLRRR